MAAEKADDNKVNDDDVPDETDGYVAPDKKSVNEIMNTDADDKSLQKYKKDLAEWNDIWREEAKQQRYEKKLKKENKKNKNKK